MPLPSSTFSLQGQARPGDVLQSGPKHAMIVRLSSATLDAIEAAPKDVDFQLGDSPGLYIGGAFYGMQFQPEDTPHELFIRSSTAAKPNGPLKLHADVVGKLNVARELGKELAEKIQKSTKEAAEQRSQRSIIVIDTPPDIPAVNKKKKDPMFRNPNRPPRQSDSNSRPSTSASNAIPSPLPPPNSNDGAVASLRKRLVHFIAIADRSSEDIVKTVGGERCDSARRKQIQGLVEEIAERPATGKPLERLWHLKPNGWVEVRPYEWPSLSESARTSMARAARLACKSLRIPESDPVWKHFQWRDSGASAPPSNVPPKRGITSKEAKERKAKPRATVTDIPMKDESKTNAKSLYTTSGDRHLNDTNSVSRRLPGSGQRNSATPVESRTPVPSTSVRPSDSTKRKKPIDDDYGALRSGNQSLPKKRKTDDPRGKAKETTSVSKKLEVPAANRSKGTPPVPPQRASLSTAVPPRAQSSSSRSRRKSPIYTSSEDEGELPATSTTVKKEKSPSVIPPPRLPPPTAPTPSISKAKSKNATPANSHALLKAHYKSTYREYIATFQQVVTQRGKIEQLLEVCDTDSIGSVTDTDGDTEIMDSEDLTKLNAKHQRLRGELENMRRSYIGVAS